MLSGREISAICCNRDNDYDNDNTRSGGMTGLYDRTPGQGHNLPPTEDKEGKWERWSKKRTFVRALEGTYSHMYKQLIDQPRVFSSKDVPWKGGPGQYGKHIISPQHANVTQSIETHIEVYAPGAYGQKHGHLNSACFYVLKGRGKSRVEDREVVAETVHLEEVPLHRPGI